MSIKDIQLKIEDAKKVLRRWEMSYKNKHNRSPTVSDVRERPKVEAYYRKYNSYKKELLKAREEGEPSSSRVLFPEALNRASTAPLEREYTEDEAFWLNISSPVIKKNDREEYGKCSRKRNLVLAKCDLAERRKRRLLEGPREDGTFAPLGGEVKYNTKKYEKKMAGFIFDKKAGFPRYYFPPEGSSDDELDDEKDAIKKLNKEAINVESENIAEQNALQDPPTNEKNTLSNLSITEKVSQHETIELAAEPIDESYLDEVQYKKKPIQKRRTRMTKIKFVDH